MRPKNIHVFFDVLQHKNDNLLVFRRCRPIFGLFKWNNCAFAGWFAVFLCTVIEGVCVFADIVKVSPEVETSGDGKK